MRPQEWDDAARGRDLQHEGWKGAGLIILAAGAVADQTAEQVHDDLIAFLYLLRGFAALQYRQADVDRITEENPRKGGRDDTGRP